MYQGCIVARRQVSFIPHTPLALPIEMTLDCLNVPCTANQTCIHAQCVTANTMCTTGTGMCTTAVSTSDASSSGDDDAPEQSGYDATTAMADGPQVDGPSIVVPEEASPMDAPATDGPPDVGLQDALIEDAPREADEDAAPEASIRDAAADVAPVESDASDASPPPTDGGLASGIDAGPSSGVECAGSRCTGGEVCCVALDPGVQTTETCMALTSCDYNGSGSTTYSALGCRNVGDCAPGKVCCASASSTGSGSISQCLTSCPYISIKQTTACQNSCECPSAQPQCNAESCALGYTIGLCGATSGSSCPL